MSTEVKEIIQNIGEAFEEYKKANDQRLKDLASGKAVADVEAKLARMDEALDAGQKRLDDIEKRQNRPQLGGVESKQLADELKAFNAGLEAKQRPFTEEQYVEYKSAFESFLRNGGNVDRLSDSERKTMIAGVDTDGGFLLPTPTVNSIVDLVRNDSVIRGLVDSVTISTNSIEGLVDRGSATSGWVGERSARTATATPTLGKDRIDVHEMYAYPELTQTILDDAAVDVEGWLTAKIARSFVDLENDTFFNGNGVGKPRGLFTYSTAATADATRTWGVFEHVATSNNGDFNATGPADYIIDLITKLKVGYLANARFLMNRAVQAKIRKLKEATTNAYMWQPGLAAGVPPSLFGYPVVIDELVPALATDSLSMAFGDFRRGFMIVDRAGMRTIRDNLTNKPYVGLYVTKRVGSAARDFDAVKFMKFGS